METASEVRVAPAASEARPLVRRIDGLPDAESAFAYLYGDSRNAFWLDSSAGGERGRFSFMGDAGGPLGALIAYDMEAGEVRVERGGAVERRRESIFDFLAGALPEPHCAPDLPFDFDCGFVGYLGYELKAECGGVAPHRAPIPDAALVFCDRLVAFDHAERRTYLLALTAPPPELHQIFNPADRKFDAVRMAGAGERWIEEASQRLESLPALERLPGDSSPVELSLRRSEDRYREDIEACRRYLRAGHSYEICLTNRVEAEVDSDSLSLYRALRRANPAPFSAYLRFGDLAVLSSSPERFLAVGGDRWVESRPIKGTSRRGSDSDEDARLASLLRDDPKCRAENVTIVDLLRNDLGRVCEVGTVSVPELMRVESYETVHQLVSAVRGRLRPGVGPTDAVRACFPPGSMTGAPKLRTMEILDELEGEARGVYSGAIGYFGLSGACDLSVVIRTIVLDGARLSIGAGGAVVADSDPEAELAEMLLKARAPAAAFSGVASAGLIAESRQGSDRR